MFGVLGVDGGGGKFWMKEGVLFLAGGWVRRGRGRRRRSCVLLRELEEGL